MCIYVRIIYTRTYACVYMNCVSAGVSRSEWTTGAHWWRQVPEALCRVLPPSLSMEAPLWLVAGWVCPRQPGSRHWPTEEDAELGTTCESTKQEF